MMIGNKNVKFLIITISLIVIGVLGAYIGYGLMGKNKTEKIVVTPPIENHIAGQELFSVTEPVTTKEPESLPEIVKEETIVPGTKVIYEYLYTEDGRVESNVEEAPYFLLGKTEVELEEIFPQWKVIRFSSGQVTLQKEVEGKSHQHYVVGVQDGYIAVFYQEPINGTSLKEITNTPVGPLSFEEQDRLRDGIDIVGDDNLFKILEDYGS